MPIVSAYSRGCETANLQDIGEDGSVEHGPGGKEGSEQSFTTRKVPDPESQCYDRNSRNNETGNDDG